MGKQTKAYAEKTNEEGKGHQFGPPHVWALGGFITGLVQKHGAATGQSNLEALTSHLEDLEMASVEDTRDICKFCSIDRTYKEELR